MDRTAPTFGTFQLVVGCIALMMAIQFAPVPARAAEPVPADPWEVIHTARKMGAAEVRRDTLRDPVIAANSDGLRYQIAFYGCHLGRRCETLLFQARLRDPRWKNDPPRPADMDVWNATKVYGRAFLAASGHAVLEHPVAMHGGIPQATLAATFEAWLDALEEFSDHVDFNTKSGP